MTELKNKNVLLIIGGGIAAFKAINIVRLLKEEKANINVILTQAGENFVTSLSLSQLSGNKVRTDLFDMTGELEMSHIDLPLPVTETKKLALQETQYWILLLA